MLAPLQQTGVAASCGKSRFLVRPALAGFLIALYILSGRWSLDRLFDGNFGGDIPFFYEVRFWVVALLAVFALLRPRLRHFSPQRAYLNAYLGAIYSLFCYLLLSVFWAPDTTMALTKGYELLLVTVATFSIYQLLEGVEGRLILEYSWKAILVFTSVLALVALYKARSLDAERLAVLGGGPNVFGRMMGLLCVSCLYYLSRGGKAVVWVPPIVVALGLVTLSGSRGSLIAIAVASVAFFIASRVPVRKVVVFGAAAAVLGFLLLNYTPMGQKVVDSFEARITNLLIQQQYTAGRGDLYVAALDLGSRNVVAGAGLAAFPALGLGVYPHNIFLESFCEAGVIGVALLLAPMLISVAAFWRWRLSLHPLSVAACALILAACQFSGDYYDSRTVFLFLLMALQSIGASETRTAGSNRRVTFSNGALLPPPLDPRDCPGVR